MGDEVPEEELEEDGDSPSLAPSTLAADFCCGDGLGGVPLFCGEVVPFPEPEVN